MTQDAEQKTSVSQTHPRIGRLVWMGSKLKALLLWITEHIVLFFFEELLRALSVSIQATFWVLARLLIFPCYILARFMELFAPKTVQKYNGKLTWTLVHWNLPLFSSLE